MRYFIVRTLIDITETKQYRKEQGRELEKNQQQNFAALLQTIAIRANPSYNHSPIINDIDVKGQGFGSSYTGNHLVWEFRFGIEYEEGFTDSNGNKVGLLIKDLHLVPIIDRLTETINVTMPIFDTQTDQHRNTVISVDSDK